MNSSGSQTGRMQDMLTSAQQHDHAWRACPRARLLRSPASKEEVTSADGHAARSHLFDGKLRAHRAVRGLRLLRAWRAILHFGAWSSALHSAAAAPSPATVLHPTTTSSSAPAAALSPAFPLAAVTAASAAVPPFSLGHAVCAGSGRLFGG